MYIVTFHLIRQKEKGTLLITTNNLYKSTFPSFNFSMFTEEDGSTINNEGKRFLNQKKF